MLNEARDIGGLALRYELTDSGQLLVVQSNRDLGRRHTDHHTIVFWRVKRLQRLVDCLWVSSATAILAMQEQRVPAQFKPLLQVGGLVSLEQQLIPSEPQADLPVATIVLSQVTSELQPLPPQHGSSPENLSTWFAYHAILTR